MLSHLSILISQKEQKPQGENWKYGSAILKAAQSMYTTCWDSENIFEMNFSIIISYEHLCMSLYGMKIVFVWLRKDAV